MRSLNLDLGPYPPQGVTASWKDSKGPKFLISINEDVDNDSAMLVATIAHECYHVVHGILECMQDENASEEFTAYMLGEVVSNIFTQYAGTRSPEARKNAERKK